MSEAADQSGTQVCDPAASPPAPEDTAGPVALKGSLLRFVAVGITNNLIGFLTFVVLSLWGMSAIGAMSISYVLGMFISFAGNRKWTFSHSGRMGSALLRFIGVNVLCYGLNAGILALFVNLLGLPQIPVQFFAVGVVASCTFLLMRLWVFSPNQGGPLTEAQRGRGRKRLGQVRYRVLLTFFGAVAVWMIAPLLIPNLAFRLMATAATAIVIWDHRLIAAFYVVMFRELGARLRAKIDQAWLLLVPSLLFCALMLWIFFSIIVNPVEPDWTVFRHNTAPVLLGSLAIMLILPSAHSAAMKTARWLETLPSWVHSVLLTAVLGLLFLIQLRLAISIYLFPGWDADAVLKTAFGVANGSVDAISPDYFAKYPNNIMLVLVLAKFSKVVLTLGGTDLLLASVVLNAGVLLCGVLLTYLVARRLAGTGAAILTLLPSTVFLVFSPWIAVPYSDSFGLLFPVLLLYLYLVARNATRWWSRLLMWGLIGFVGLVGFNIKPTVIFAVIAIVLVFLTATVLAKSTLRERVLALGSVGAALGVFMAGSSAVTYIQQSSPVISFDVANNPKAFPLTHFLKMGATGYGGYAQADVRQTAAIKDPDERFRNGVDVYAQRVQAMGPVGYADFLARKATWTFGDGTFHMWSEGVVKNQDDPFISKDPTSRSFQDYLWAKGEHFPFTSSVWQSFWMVIILLTAAPLVLRGRRLFTGPSAIMRLSLLALFLFLLLFEARSRYLYLYLPFFILLATLTLDSVMHRLLDLGGRPGRRSASAGWPASRG